MSEYCLHNNDMYTCVQCIESFKQAESARNRSQPETGGIAYHAQYPNGWYSDGSTSQHTADAGHNDADHTYATPDEGFERALETRSDAELQKFLATTPGFGENAQLMKSLRIKATCVGFYEESTRKLMKSFADARAAGSSAEEWGRARDEEAMNIIADTVKTNPMNVDILNTGLESNHRRLLQPPGEKVSAKLKELRNLTNISEGVTNALTEWAVYFEQASE